jgi:hypothetical protein
MSYQNTVPLRYWAAQVDVFRARVKMYADDVGAFNDQMRRFAIKAQHPDWPDDQVEAHLALHRPAPQPGTHDTDRQPR